VYIQGDQSTINVAATDSFRLAEEVITLKDTGDFSLLLPLHCAQEVVRLFASQDEIRISPQENHVLFYGEGIELSSRLVDGSYPDYKQVIPQDWKTRVSVVRDDIVRALKTLTVFLPKDSRRVQLIVKPSKGQFLAKVVGSESGQGDVKLLCEGEGEDVETLVNIQYLLDGLQHISTDVCVIEMGGSQSPIVFRPDNKNNKYVYVVMPIQAQ
jgi:DNA polymerase-3 subunit beta